MERKRGEIFEYNGEWYQCVEELSWGVHCNGCDFLGRICSKLNPKCSPTHHRSDGKFVIFKKLERVGEPITVKDRTFQCLNAFKTECTGCVFLNSKRGCDKRHYIDDPCFDREIWVEIKQSMEEDREYSEEEFKNNPRFQHHKNIEQVINMKKMKEFDINLAKQGKPVCTRDGRKARIICFDANIMTGNKNILALIRKDDSSEYVEYYTSNGKFSDSKDDINDLMMLTEKKEGWVNIDKGGSGKITVSSPYSTKEEAIHNDNETTIDTIKISWED